jgi:hypothetical protein
MLSMMRRMTVDLPDPDPPATPMTSDGDAVFPGLFTVFVSTALACTLFLSASSHRDHDPAPNLVRLSGQREGSAVNM